MTDGTPTVYRWVCEKCATWNERTEAPDRQWACAGCGARWFLTWSLSYWRERLCGALHQRVYDQSGDLPMAFMVLCDVCKAEPLEACRQIAAPLAWCAGPRGPYCWHADGWRSLAQRDGLVPALAAITRSDPGAIRAEIRAAARAIGLGRLRL